MTNLILTGLQKKVNYSEFGVITKEEFIRKAKALSWTVKAKELNGYQNGQYNRRHFNQLTGDAQRKYEEGLSRIKTVYSIYPPTGTGFYDITRTEFEFFNSL